MGNVKRKTKTCARGWHSEIAGGFLDSARRCQKNLAANVPVRNIDKMFSAGAVARPSSPSRIAGASGKRSSQPIAVPSSQKM